MNKKIPFPIAIIIIVICAILVGLVSMWGYRLIPGIEIFPLTPPGKTLTEEEWFAKCTDATTIVLFHEQINCYRDFLNDGYSEKSCEKIGEKNKDFCYLGAAIAKRDETICGMSKSLESLCNILLSIIKGGLSEEENIVRCEGFPTCYEYIFAEEGYEGKICEKVKEEEKENCYVGAAAAKKDENLCDKTVELKRVCYKIVAITKKDESLCERIKLWVGIECYAGVAVIKNDYTICEKIGEDKDDCYLVIAGIKNDENLCEKTGKNKESCYTSMAEKKNNEVLCEKAGEERDLCYYKLAIKRKDEFLCEKAGEKRNGCYLGIAIDKKDKTLCEKIDSESDKKTCYNSIK